jgi:hypothetical protein
MLRVPRGGTLMRRFVRPADWPAEAARSGLQQRDLPEYMRPFEHQAA